MKLFIWENVAPIADAWHSSGGVVAIAETVEDARELVSERIRPLVEDSSNNTIDGLDVEPHFEVDVFGPVEPQVFLFPDSGCC